MVKENVYMVIPEPHIWDKNISTRIDYVGEIKIYMGYIKDLAYKVSQRPNTELRIIFMGDIFHQGMKSSKEVLYWYQYFLGLNSVAEEVYSVIGNHELSYQKDNLFWHLVSNTQHTSIKSVDAYGEFPLLKVVDTIEDVGTKIHLNHHGVLASVEDDGDTHVGLFHHSIIDVEVAETLRNKYGRDPLESYIDHTYIGSQEPFKNYDYAFVGHMHKAYGLFTVEDDLTGKLTRLRYLASIGRTNRNEIDDTDLDRVVPLIKVKQDTGEVSIEEIGFSLMPYEQVVNQEAVELSKEKYEEQKEKKELRRSVCASSEPLQDLRMVYSKIPVVQRWIDDSSRGVIPREIKVIMEAAEEKIRWEEFRL